MWAKESGRLDDLRAGLATRGTADRVVLLKIQGGSLQIYNKRGENTHHINSCRFNEKPALACVCHVYYTCISCFYEICKY